MKPWAVSSDKEKLSGFNGLLLSPHIDRLFDKGWISFGDDGTVLVSPKLDRSILRRWGIGKITNVGPFKPEQLVYLKYHRSKKLKK
jgi:hypothetical protein